MAGDPPAGIEADHDCAGAGAVLLTGGASTRMGRPKPWLLLGEQPVLLRIVDELTTACDPVLVIAAPGQDLPLDPVRGGNRVQRIDDPPERRGLGPLGGILTGLEVLEHLEIPLAYLGSVDGALVSGAHVRFLLETLARHPQRQAVAPMGPPLHPLASVVRVPAARRAAAALWAQGERRARALFGRGGLMAATHTVPAAALPDPRVLSPCNTPDEWERVRTWWAAAR